MLTESRVIWAEYFEGKGVKYAFFSATDAAAALEQAEKHRRREAGEDYDEDEAEERNDDDEAQDEKEDVAGEHPSADDVDEVESDALDKTTDATALEDGEEDGWSTEGEDEDDLEDDELETRLANGHRLPLEEVVRNVENRNGLAEEDIRTRVLSVTELEDLFESAAPDLRGPSIFARSSILC